MDRKIEIEKCREESRAYCNILLYTKEKNKKEKYIRNRKIIGLTVGEVEDLYNQLGFLIGV